jgi:hypothetical protein
MLVKLALLNKRQKPGAEARNETVVRKHAYIRAAYLHVPLKVVCGLHRGGGRHGAHEQGRVLLSQPCGQRARVRPAKGHPGVGGGEAVRGGHDAVDGRQVGQCLLRGQELQAGQTDIRKWLGAACMPVI